MQEATHATGVRPAVHLEEELLLTGRREHVGVMRSAARPWLDADLGERAARDLVGCLGDQIRRRRDGERAHGRDESSGAAAYAQRVSASWAATWAFARSSAMFASSAR